MQYADGTLFGVTATGGFGFGSVYTITPAGEFQIVYSFTGGSDGATPSGPLLQGSDGAIYGTNSGTGRGGDATGVVFRLRPTPSTAVSPSRPRAAEGESVRLTVLTQRVSVQSLQWQVSTDNGSTFSPIAGATGASYTVAATLALNGTQFRALVTSAAGTVASLPATVIVHRVGTPPVRSDLDGDRQGDLVVWRPGNGTWFSQRSSTGYSETLAAATQWGPAGAGDVPFLADMDGDGLGDLIVWRPSAGTWFWLTSSSGFDYAAQGQKQWGNQGLGDVPLLGDMDGDGKTDLVVWRATTGTWYWLPSSTGFTYASAVARQLGNAAAGDVPILTLADVDGDGRADLVVWRASTGTWFWLPSSSGYAYAAARAKQWGSAAAHDIPMSR